MFNLTLTPLQSLQSFARAAEIVDRIVGNTLLGFQTPAFDARGDQELLSALELLNIPGEQTGLFRKLALFDDMPRQQTVSVPLTFDIWSSGVRFQDIIRDFVTLVIDGFSSVETTEQRILDFQPVFPQPFGLLTAAIDRANQVPPTTISNKHELAELHLVYEDRQRAPRRDSPFRRSITKRFRNTLRYYVRMLKRSDAAKESKIRTPLS